MSPCCREPLTVRGSEVARGEKWDLLRLFFHVQSKLLGWVGDVRHSAGPRLSLLALYKKYGLLL